MFLPSLRFLRRRYAGIDIPTLCYLKDINQIGACRLCLVEVVGARGLVTACVYPANEGMEILTNTAKVQAARKTNIELVLSAHEKKCLSCIRSTNCELQKFAKRFRCGCRLFQGRGSQKAVDTSTAFLVETTISVSFAAAASSCEHQGIGAIGAVNRGFDTEIAPAFDKTLPRPPAFPCGQCIVACPVGALYEKDDTARVFEALSDPTKHVAICTAPSVRATLGECFGYEPGTDVEGKMAAALRRLGFDGVYDMNFPPTSIIEEAHEFIERVQNGGKLPLIHRARPDGLSSVSIISPR